MRKKSRILFFSSLVIGGISFTLLVSARKNRNEIEFSSNHEVIAFDITQVKLINGPFFDAQERDKKYLLSLEPDRFLTYFRITAGLDSLVPAYKGWESSEVRGHFSGHYMSACAMMYAATGDIRLKRKMDTLITGLKECQDANKDGYISAFPRSFIDRVEKNKKVWAPYYTIHKILAGLLDVNNYCGNNIALLVASNMTDWIGKRFNHLNHNQIQKMLDSTEQGGMNEVLFNIYKLTGKKKYLDLARKFYEESYFRPLSKHIDSLAGQHVNSFIPNVIGLARDYELTGDTLKKDMVHYFWKEVTEARSFVTGGTGNDEHWNTSPYHLEHELGPSSEESCCTYNMLKLTRHLFTWDPKISYADYYERALWNGILPTQDPETGMTMYYMPMSSGYYKTFSTPENSFWCCTGTGIENFAKAANSIYFGKGDSLFVNLFIASKLNLPEKGFSLVQETEFPNQQKTTFRLILKVPTEATIMLRAPSWLAKGYTIKVNDRNISYKVKDGYAAIKRTWENNDKISYTLPMKLSMEALPDDKNKVAFLYGPIVLAGALGNYGVTYKKEYGVDGPYNDKPIEVPVIRKGSSENLNSWMIRNGPLSFYVASTKGDSVHYIPFYQLFGQRYMIYSSLSKK